MAHHIGNATTSQHWSEHCNDLIYRARRPLSRQLRRRLPAAAVARRQPGQLHSRARALRQRARLRRLQPQSRSDGRLLDRPAADRPLVVSALREDGGARRARHDPCGIVLQPELPRHRRPLPGRRHDGLHAAAAVQAVQGLPDAEVHHSAWRRRGAVPLGPLSRPGAGHEASAAAGTAAEQRVLRHLRLSPARRVAADPGHPGEERAVRLGDGRRRQGRRPGDRLQFRRHEALHRRLALAHGRRQAEDIRGQCARRLSPARREAEEQRASKAARTGRFEK